MKKLMMVVVIVILTALGTAWAQDKGIETKTLGFTYGTTFRVENNVAQYQLPGEQTWQNMPLSTNSQSITPVKVTWTGKKIPNQIVVGVIIDHSTNQVILIVPVIKERQTLKQKLIDNLLTIYCGETIYWVIPIKDH